MLMIITQFLKNFCSLKQRICALWVQLLPRERISLNMLFHFAFTELLKIYIWPPKNIHWHNLHIKEKQVIILWLTPEPQLGGWHSSQTSGWNILQRSDILIRTYKFFAAPFTIMCAISQEVFLYQRTQDQFYGKKLPIDTRVNLIYASHVSRGCCNKYIGEYKRTNTDLILITTATNSPHWPSKV